MPGIPPVIAHRGASAEAPENTLAAFRRALAVGARGVELDVHLTSDGQPVVIHDETVDRTTDGQGPVKAFPLAALQSLDAGASFHRRYAGEAVPTLEEALELLTPRALVNIEVKTVREEYPGIEAAVADVVEAMGVAEQVLVSSFNPASVRRFRDAGTGAATAVIVKGALTEDEADAYQEFADGLGLEARAARRGGTALAKAHGYRVVAWTVNRVAPARHLLALGVDGVITDNPRRLIEGLGEAATSRGADAAGSAASGSRS